MLIEIREERPDDIAAVRGVNRRAFEQEQESNIIDGLRMNRAALFSLVATASERVTGHIISSPELLLEMLKARRWDRWQYLRNISDKELVLD